MRREDIDQQLAAKVAESFVGCNRGKIHTWAKLSIAVMSICYDAPST